MRFEQLFSHYPRLYHMAESGSWPAIQRIGLKTTAQLVDDCAPGDDVEEAILRSRRSTSFRLSHPEVGDIVIRDQAPLLLHNLRPSLIDLTVEEWLTILNNRVFFWVDERRLNRLLEARLYRGSCHDVMVLDTKTLVEAYEAKVRLSPMNTGSTIFPKAVARGSSTFTTVQDFPFDERRRSRTLENTVVELSVIGGVPDVASYVLEVQRRVGSTTTDIIYRP